MGKFIARTHGGVRNDSETHETVLLDCTTGEAGVCEMTVKRTRLCYWIALPAKPGVQSSNIRRVCFTVISHTPVRSGFYHIHIVDRRNCDGSCLLNLTQQSCIFFKVVICSIALLNLGETCHLKGRGMVTVWCTVLLLCCYDSESTQQHYDITLLEYVLWRHTMHEWVMNIHYQNMNRPRAIHKHHPHPLETMGHVW